jgi:hypothetical protein
MKYLQQYRMSKITVITIEYCHFSTDRTENLSEFSHEIRFFRSFLPDISPLFLHPLPQNGKRRIIFLCSGNVLR